MGTILVVDDFEANRALLVKRLERLEYTTLEASSGAEALEKLKTESIDLVLLDIMMPGISGYDVLEAMQQDPQMREIPVIVISAIDEIQSIVKCIEMGAVDYLPKPFNPIILQARVKNCMGRRPSA